MAADIDRAGVAKAYERWAPVYDLVFGKVFEHGRQSTIAEADKIGGRILDVGVGTGLSLSDYSSTTKLCGVDISEPMLRKAQSRVRALGLHNVETLAVMDAKNLAFKDSYFDAVVAQYVITAVPDPEATLDDFIRVLKPGGELILVNHIGAESGDLITCVPLRPWTFIRLNNDDRLGPQPVHCHVQEFQDFPVRIGDLASVVLRPAMRLRLFCAYAAPALVHDERRMRYE